MILLECVNQEAVFPETLSLAQTKGGNKKVFKKNGQRERVGHSAVIALPPAEWHLGHLSPYATDM